MGANSANKIKTQNQPVKRQKQSTNFNHNIILKSPFKPQHLIQVQRFSSSVKNLQIKQKGLQKAQMEEIANSNWSQLKELSISYDEDDEQGLSVLLNGQRWNKIAILELHCNKPLDAANPLMNIKQLRIKRDAIRTIGSTMIAKGTCWQNLSQAYFDGNHMGDDGLMRLSQANWTYLTVLVIDSNQLTCKGISSLTNGKMRGLKYLSLRHNKLKNQSIRFLTQSNWSELGEIELSYNMITVEGVLQLHRGGWYLKSVSVKGNCIPKWNIPIVNNSLKSINDKVQIKF